MRAPVLLLLLVVVVEVSALSGEEVSRMKDRISSHFQLAASYGDYCNSRASACAMGDNMGALVRLPFHDATGGSGPNGCIDFDCKANNGLQDVIAALDVIYPEFEEVVSKADFWVLAGNVAIEHASTPGPSYDSALSHMDPTPGPLILPFRYGRKDVVQCNDEGFLPDANFTWAKTKEIFGGRFGMSVEEVVAIMGAHSLGRAQFNNSGYDGGWSAYQSSFSNNYFKNFNTSQWKNLNGSDVYIAGNTMSLQADVEIYFQTNQSSSSSGVAGEGVNEFSNSNRGDDEWNSTYCDVFESYAPTKRCPLQVESHHAFLTYANKVSGMNMFYGNFSRGWQLMTEYMQDGLLHDVVE